MPPRYTPLNNQVIKTVRLKKGPIAELEAALGAKSPKVKLAFLLKVTSSDVQKIFVDGRGLDFLKLIRALPTSEMRTSALLAGLGDTREIFYNIMRCDRRCFTKELELLGELIREQAKTEGQPESPVKPRVVRDELWAHSKAYEVFATLDSFIEYLFGKDQDCSGPDFQKRVEEILCARPSLQLGSLALAQLRR